MPCPFTLAAKGVPGSVVGGADGVKVAVATDVGVKLAAGSETSGVAVFVPLLHATNPIMASKKSPFWIRLCNFFQVISPIILAQDDKWCPIAADC